MTFEETIQGMYDRYPILFQDRAQCLNHLFCVLGNGYEWRDGALESPDCPSEPVHGLTDGKAVQHRVLTRRSEMRLAAEISGLPVDEAKLASVPDTPPRRRPRNEAWYFVHPARPGGPARIELYKEYVPLWHVPPDVRPDWAAGVRECLDMLLEDGIVTQADADGVFPPGTAPEGR